MSRETSPLRDRVAFLVGVRRSGTNWLRRIVDAHPDAAVIPGETYLLSHGIAPLTERTQHGLAGSARTGTVFVDRDGFLDAVRDLCDCILGGHLRTLDATVQLLAERTPDHVRHLDLIGDVFPDAAVVHIIRDGRDVARSLVSQSWGPTSHAEAAEEWVSGIEAARRVAPRLPKYLEVSYEELLADPVTQVPALYRFLGLDASDDVVRRALAEADVPYNVDPASRTVTAAKWREGLGPDELAEVLAVATPLLTDLGYLSGPAAVTATGNGAATGNDGARAPVLARSDGARRVASGLRRRLADVLGRDIDRGGATDDAAFQRELLRRFERTMTVVDELLADVAARRFDDLDRHFSSQVRIRVAGSGDAWDDRGPAAVRRLATTWADDPALRGRQRRGDVHPGAPSFTVVGTWETDGDMHDRVLVVTRFDDRIGELTWYVLPRLGPEEGRP